MKTEDKRIYYNKENHPFFSRKDAAKSNLILNFRKLKKEHDVKTTVDKANKDFSKEVPDNIASLVITIAVEMYLPDLLADYPHIVEELLHEYYKDMGEEVKIGDS